MEWKFLYLPRNFPYSVSLLRTKKSCSVSRKSFPKYGRVMHQITILFWYTLKDSVIKSRKTLPIQNILLPFGGKGINFFRKKNWGYINVSPVFVIPVIFVVLTRLDSSALRFVLLHMHLHIQKNLS